MDMPCCNIKYHAACGIQKLAQQMYSFNTVVHCTCGSVLYEHIPLYQETEQDIVTAVETIRAKPGAVDEINMVKKALTEENKVQKVYMKLLKEKQAEFKEAVAPHIDAIKHIKTTMINIIKQTDECKNLNKIKKKRVILEHKFKTKHEASRDQMRRMLGYARWGPIWYNRHCTAISLLHRRFRIRL